MLYFIPVFIVLLFIVVIVLFFLHSFSEVDKTKADKEALTTLQAQFTKIIEKQTELDQRLTNLEHIVTDDRFTKPLEPKESINIKKEMDDLKTLIKRLSHK